ncbi:MAG: hypothetical protein E7368_04670 [Clostridiales bacterium]|nr:hypothetical protein [Clostridiales bacterium]
MRKSRIEKQLKNELRQATPTAFDEIWNKCEEVSAEKEKEYVVELEKVAVGVENETRKAGGKRTFATLTALFLAMVLAIVAVWGATAGWFKKDGGGNGIDKPTMSKGYFILDINPSLEVDYDENGNVSEVVGLNADGKVLIYGMEEAFVGKPYTQVVDLLFERCVRLGYFSAENTTNAVLVSATKDVGEKDEVMTENVRKRFAELFVEKKLCGVAITGKEDPSLKAEADKYGVDSQKYALIQEYLALVEKLGVESEIDQEDYAEISIREIYEALEELEEFKIGDSVSDSIEGLLEEMEDALEQELGEDVFEELEELAEELEKAKSFEELNTIAEPLLDLLQRLELGAYGADKEMIRMTQDEVRAILNGMQADKENLHKPTEEAFKEREEKHKDNYDKEAEEPEGGFEAWQEENREHFEENWNDKKENWQGHQKHQRETPVR